MNFYLNKYGFCPPQLNSTPKKDLGIIIVIPCFNEPDLVRTLRSLDYCDSPECSVEVIVVLNSSETSSQGVLKQNEKSKIDFLEFVTNKRNDRIDYHLIDSPNLPKKHAGVGLARKIGMDEAVYRFHSIDHDGIIVCFDADSLCDNNYLVSIENHFQKFPKTPGCSIHYEHPTSGKEFERLIYEGIVNYELHLRYYNQCFRFCDLPYAFHTVGSSMAVRSSAYQKQGGMNKRKAGEDFYFLHKIIALGNFTELKSTKVIPSPRVSDRVPFGTGKAIGEWIDSSEEEYYTYNFYIFIELKKFITLIPSFYEKEFNSGTLDLHPAFVEYFSSIGIEDKLEELVKNTKDFEGFKKRFFVWFDAFQVMKLVHHMQNCGFGDIKILRAVNHLLQEKGDEPLKSNLDQLLYFRELEKK